MLPLCAQSTVALVWETDRSGVFTGATSATATAAGAKVSNHAGLTIVRAGVEGEWGNFILDTGAPGLVLNAAPSDRANRRAVGLFGACAGDTQLVRRFAWQGTVYENVAALRIDLSGIEKRIGIPLKGLFGYDQLRKHVLQLDLSNERLLLNPDKARLRGKAMRLNDRARLPIVRVKINGRTYRFGIDSGASVNVLSERLHRRLSAEDCRLLGSRNVCGVGQQRTLLPVVALEGLQIGGIPEPATTLCVTDLQAFERDHGLRLDGILGRPFLERHVVTIDYPARRVWVE